jgi:hypothetical protein
METEKITYNYFIVKNKNTKETKEFKIGPMPIDASKMDSMLRKEHKKLGIPYTQDSEWIISKAWTAP